mgnify:CR=1 FL=1
MKKLLLVTVVMILGATTLYGQSEEPPYGLRPIEVYSIFYENYKNEDYFISLPYGRWLIHNRPHKLEGLDQYDGPRTFRRMANVYKGLAEDKDDPNVKSTYLDSVIYVYQLGLETYEPSEIDTFSWKLDMGRFYQENSDYIDNGMEKAVSIYKKLIMNKPEKGATVGDGYYAQVTVQNMVSNGEKDAALRMIRETEPYVNEKLTDYYDSVRDQLFSSPEERITYLEGKIEENPEDTESMAELVKLYKDMEMFKEARNLTRKLYELEPNYDNTLRVAEIAQSNANYEEAIQFYKEAAGKTEDGSELKNIYLELSDVYLNIDQLQSARRNARKALEYDSDWGRPYIKIANIYGQAVTQCTSEQEMTRKDKVVYWLVLDYLDKAKRVDSSVASTVERQYSSYENVTPTVEEKFYQNWETGDNIKVDGSLKECYSWINETTTVR